MAQSNIGGYITTGVGRGTEAYGAWYEGEQGKNYYKTMQSLTIRQKNEARELIRSKYYQLNIMRGEAADAYNQAEDIGRMGEIKADYYQKETDKAVAGLFANLAKSGVSMTYGSPLEYIDNVVTERAKGLGILKWQNQRDVYKAETQAAAIYNRGSLVLHEAKVMSAGLDMFNYQYQTYKQAEKEAGRAAEWKQFSAFLGAFSDSFGGMSGASNMGGTSSSGGTQSTDMGEYGNSSQWMGGDMGFM